MTIKEINEKMGAVSKKMHDIIDGTETTLSEEKRAEYDGLGEEYRALAETRIRMEQQAAIDMQQAVTDNSAEEVRSVPAVAVGEEMTEMEMRAADAAVRAQTGSKPYARWINALAKGAGMEEVRALAEVRADESLIANSTSIIDKKFSYDVIRRADELCSMADHVTTVYARGTYSQMISKVNSSTDTEYIVQGGWVAENGAIGRSDIRYDTIDIKPYKYGREVLLTLEMLNQHTENLNLVDDVLEQFARSFARGKEQGIIKGAGDLSGQPTGLISGGTYFTLPATGVITSSNLVDMYHALKTWYTQDACWVMNRQTLSVIRQLKDAVGNYVFKPNENWAYGFAGTIFGKEVLVSEEMPALEANESTTAYGNSPILYGDFREGYRAIQNPDITVKYLDQLHALNGGVGILGLMWLGGKVVNNEAYINVRVDKASE